MAEDRSTSSWSDYVKVENFFTNAIRLRYLIWTILRMVPPGSRLLETGFGSGKTALMMVDMGYHVTAIDVDSELVKRVRSENQYYIQKGRLEVLELDMTALPWQEITFDLAYHQGVLEHFPDDMIVCSLREQARVSKWIIFDVPNHRYGTRPFGDERLLPPSRWRKLIKEAGLELVRELGRGFRPWHYLLPQAFFSNKGVYKFPQVSRWLGNTSIFVCRGPHGE